jgi:hypothetical protein
VVDGDLLAPEIGRCIRDAMKVVVRTKIRSNKVGHVLIFLIDELKITTGTLPVGDNELVMLKIDKVGDLVPVFVDLPDAVVGFLPQERHTDLKQEVRQTPDRSEEVPVVPDVIKLEQEHEVDEVFTTQ